MLLKLSGPDVYYGAVRALHQVSLEVKKGEIVAILGANGARKTTLLKTLSGLVPAASGKVIFDGEDLTNAQSHLAVQKVAIARALMARPRLLLVEQKAHMALTVAHRAYVLENGEVTVSGPAATGVTAILGGPFWGAQADRFGKRPLLLRSAFWLVLVLIGFAFSRSSRSPHREAPWLLGMLAVIVVTTFATGAVDPPAGSGVWALVQRRLPGGRAPGWR